ncbi:hypothetical protein [Caldisalinibacter kiritimatiensis]|uniref:DUF1573 domain-containing protein n=1 Tax=Caldisalinibacter kiritimatiensis TaxID=1304284 RepID=R1AVF3_9FIRM|nr:hypothetical protein [Caldisalinibacter kiritimatiensis]EOD00637.1 hypothetical protein L21TH_1307 [Caldisalinibacter kiritimatiensis]
MEKDSLCNKFQNAVSDTQLRHKSILDILTKLEESNARVNRAIVKSVTSCGCIEINATKQCYNKPSLQEVKESLKNHIEGELCETCREKIQEELGNHMYYVASLCDALELNLDDIISKEFDELKTLGIYSLL